MGSLCYAVFVEKFVGHPFVSLCLGGCFLLGHEGTKTQSIFLAQLQVIFLQLTNCEVHGTCGQCHVQD